MEHSSELKNIAAALSKAQAEFPIFKKEKTVKVKTRSGSEYTYNYTDLGAMFAGVIPVLSTNGLCFSQSVDHQSNDIIIVSLLLHSSGEFLKSTLRLPVVDDTKNIVQSIGSSITYGRRYAAGALLGVASEADDDANSAGEGGPVGSAPASNGNGYKKQKEKAPNCIKCGKQKYVIISKRDSSKWYCLRSKGGCGATWDREPKKTESGAAANGTQGTADDKSPKEESPRDKKLRQIFNLFVTAPVVKNVPEEHRGRALMYYIRAALNKEIIDKSMLTDKQIDDIISSMAKNSKQIDTSVSEFIDILNSK